MQGIDTNVLVRLIVNDDPAQCEAARRWAKTLTAEAPGYVCLITCAEFIWVLTRTYGFEKATIIRALRSLLQAPEIVFEGADDLEAALLKAEQSNADIDDAIIVIRARQAGCSNIVTFDRRASTRAGMTLLDT